MREHHYMLHLAAGLIAVALLAACAAPAAPSPATPASAAPSATPQLAAWSGPLPSGAIALYATGAWEDGELYALTGDGRTVDLGRRVIGAARSSPSGRWLACLDERTRPQAVIISDLISGRSLPVPLTIGRGTGYVAWGAFDREEARLAFVEVAAISPTPTPGTPSWQLVVVDLRDGSTQRFEAARPADGSAVLPGYPLGWSATGELVLDAFRPYSGASAGIWAFTLPAGAAPAPTMAGRQLLPRGAYSAPRLSPAGTHLLYLACDAAYPPAGSRPIDGTAAMSQLWSLDVASGEATCLVEARGGDALAPSAAWSPDGSTVLFVQGRYTPGSVPGELPALAQPILIARDAAGAVRTVAALPDAGPVVGLSWCAPGTAAVTLSLPGGAARHELYTVDLASGGTARVAEAAHISVLGGVMPEPATAALPPAPAPTATRAPGPPALSLRAPAWLGRGAIVDACFSPGGRLLAVGWGNGVSLWSAETGAERWWQPTNVCLIAVDIQPQGQAVAALLQDGSVAVFDAATGAARRFKGAAPDVYWGDVAWSPDGARIAFQAIGPDRGDPIYLVDAQDGAVEEVPQSRIGSGTHLQLAWSPDGQAITLASLRTCSTLVDVQTGQMRLSLSQGGSCHTPYALAWSPDGHSMATVGSGKLDLLDAQTGQAALSMAGGVGGLPLTRAGRVLSFSPDGQLLASRGGQGAHPTGWMPLQVWDAATGRLVGRLEGRRTRQDRLAVALDGDSALSLYATGEIARWPIGAGEADETTVARLPVLAPLGPVAWSADGSRMAAAGRDGGVAVWDTATGAALAAFGPTFCAPGLSRDGRLLAMTDTERHEEVIYDLAAGRVVRALPAATPILQGAAFSPDGRFVAYARDNRALVAEVAAGRVVAELAGYPEGQAIARAIWAPDGSALVVASSKVGSVEEAGPIILWERAGDGGFREAFRTQSVRSYSRDKPVALFSPSGALVAFEELPRAEAGMMSVQVFDRRSGRTVLRLQDYALATWVSDEVLLTAEAQSYTRLTQWNVQSGAKAVGRGRDLLANVYAPGGGYYAMPSSRPYSDRGVEVHDWEEGRLMCRVSHGAGMAHIAWSPDGARIASLAINGTVVVWRIEEGPCEEE